MERVKIFSVIAFTKVTRRSTGGRLQRNLLHVLSINNRSKRFQKSNLYD